MKVAFVQKCQEVLLLEGIIGKLNSLNNKTTIGELFEVDKQFFYFLREVAVHLSKEEQVGVINRYTHLREQKCQQIIVVKNFKKTVDICQPRML